MQTNFTAVSLGATIGINGRFLRYPATGSGQNTFHLLEELAKRSDDASYVLLGPGPRQALDSPSAVAVAAARLRGMPTGSLTAERIQRLWWEQIGIVAAARAEHIDLLHFPYFSAPLVLPTPTVVTVHDVITLILPEYRERLMNRAYTWLVALAVRRAAAIIAVSECCAGDVARVLGIPLDRIRVIGNAVDEGYRPIEDPGRLEAVRARYGLPERFILYLGGFDVRKNVFGVLRAFARLPLQLRSAYPLAVAGGPRLLGHRLYPDPRPLTVQLEIEGSVRFVGEVDEADKPAVYSAATLFVWPSLYEGFGIPVLEAMACGTPTITSNNSALPELAAEAARLVDPRDLGALADAMAELLEDADARAELRRRGLKRASQYSWERVADQTVAVYRSVLAAPSP